MADSSEERSSSPGPGPDNSLADSSSSRRWQPIGPIERRVLGVLVEKAKTTPDVYPLSLNAITAGANQKSNRHPVMQLEPEDVQTALDRLRAIGAVGLVEGYGRVPKYRHYLYEWLGVDKVEAAVMAELLLRGPQTEGELRAHASRMEPLPDLATLRQILASLKAKGLVVSLTPEGRGHVVAHALYPSAEMQRLQAEYQQAIQPLRPEVLESTAVPRAEGMEVEYGIPASPSGPKGDGPAGASASALASVQAELSELRQQLADLRQQVETLLEKSRQQEELLGWLRKELGV